MLVHGGIGSSPLDDVALLDGTTMTWRTPSTTAASSKDRPEKIWGHSAVEAGGNVWFFGGQQGRKLLNKLYSLNVSSLVWKRHSPSSLPTPRAGHSMLTGPAGRVFLFGGQAKKLLNDLHCLEPLAPEQGFSIIQGRGTLPSPRRGQSLVWDGGDYLILFGGTSERGIDAALHVYSFHRQEWFVPTATGHGPSPRTQHSAVMVSPQTMMVFGGCNAQGVFFNDAYILDTSSWSWSKPQTLNTPPAPRYHHSCVMVNGRCVIYGGVNAKQTFEGLVVVETKVDHDISNIAAELSAMVRPYGAGQSLASGSADVGLNASNHSPPPAALLPAHVLPAPQLGTSGVQASNLATGSVDLVRASTSSSNSTTNGQQAVQQNQDSSPSGHGPPPRSYSSQTAGPSTATAGLYATSPAHVAALQTQQPVLVVTQHPTAPHSIQVPRQAQLNQPSVLVSSLVPATTIASVPADVMQLQLTELLIRRNTEELSNQVSQKAAAIESELMREREVTTALNKELLQLRLLVAEAEAERKEWEVKAKETTLKLNKEAATASDAQAQLASLQREATTLRQDLAAARSLQDGLVKELGIVTSRYTRLHQHYEAQRKWRTSRQASRINLGSPAGPAAGSEAAPVVSGGSPHAPTASAAGTGEAGAPGAAGSLADLHHSRLSQAASTVTVTPGASNNLTPLQLLQGMESPLLSSSPEAEEVLEPGAEGLENDSAAGMSASLVSLRRRSLAAAGGAPSSTPVVGSSSALRVEPASVQESLQGGEAGPSNGLHQLSRGSAPGRQEGQVPLRRRQTALPLPHDIASSSPAGAATPATSQQQVAGLQPGTSDAPFASPSLPGAFGSWLVDSLPAAAGSNATLNGSIPDCSTHALGDAAGAASEQQQQQHYFIGPLSRMATAADLVDGAGAGVVSAQQGSAGQASTSAAGAPGSSSATMSNESFACARLLAMLNAAESARAQVVEKHALLQAAHAALLAEHEDLEALAQSAGSLRAAATVAQAERAAALTEVASLRAEVEALQKQVAALSAEVARAMGRPDALTSLTLSELAGLEGQLEAALRSVREATLRRTIEAAAQRVSSEQAACALCLEAPKGTVFNCGHQACSGCASKLDTCPFCRVPITTRIKLFES